ncbi:MAG TPA: nucleoside triphosphate pyrophosphohydrolase [Polyangiales bacterium]|jgi:tetrapyrrole methylase family protein/MazG family protein/ATP diphosphatase|nr:nucleoside triphosphate pyrophosphohydrolase [Polyangiales bacterium]
MKLPEQNGQSLPRLVEIMQRLLAPDGCPWDREQTLETLRPYVIEEAHEVVDAIDRGAPDELREELGDLLLQIVFQAELARAQGWFGPDDVVAGICEKLVRRHPHVFGDEKVSGTAEVLANWEAIKAREKAGRGVLDGVPKALPGLLRATRMGEKAARVGFDWPDLTGARAKVDEELSELDEAVRDGDRTRVEHELGDVLFSLVSVARKLDVDPEAALRGTLERFGQRVRWVENHAEERGQDLSALDEAALDALWRQAKAEL